MIQRQITAHNPTTRLIVFSDDWGRHPSSCQHLIAKLLDRYPTLWVNTIGTRMPKWSAEDFAKVAAKLRQWSRSNPNDRQPGHRNLQVISPRMFPGFRKDWQRSLNRSLITRQVNNALGPRVAGERRIAITTVPITADLIGSIDADQWLYYCVDDFATWPGLDGDAMDAMERKQAAHVDAAVAVSQILMDRLATMNCEASLLTHGIDLHHWQLNRSEAHLPQWWPDNNQSIATFWGVVDQRLDSQWCQAIANEVDALLLIGPHQSPDPLLAATENIIMPGPVGYEHLPAIAAASDVLVMPYADLPVTRAMQPLKFKEYLATDKPVIVRDLPSTRAWRDTADVVDCSATLAPTVRQRLLQGVPAEQLTNRKRLASETWDAKADALHDVLHNMLQHRGTDTRADHKRSRFNEAGSMATSTGV